MFIPFYPPLAKLSLEHGKRTAVQALFWIKKARDQLKARFEYIKNQLLEKRWVRFIAHVVNEMANKYAADMAAALAYYAIIAIFPLLLGIIALLGLILPSATVQQYVLNFIAQNLPGAVEVVRDNIISIIQNRGTLGVISIATLLWLGSTIFGSVDVAVNRAWSIYHFRPFYIRKIRDLILAMSTAFLFFLSLGSAAFFSVFPTINLPVVQSAAVLVGELLAFLFVFVLFLLIYKFVPNTRVAWRNIWPGTLLAAILFEVARVIFVFYLNRFINYQLIYGSLASLIIFLLWIYYSAFILILGAEVSSVYSRLRQGQLGSP